MGRLWSKRAHNAVDDYIGRPCQQAKCAVIPAGSAWQPLDLNQRYSCFAMPSKPTPFPHLHQSQEPEPAAIEHSRWIFCIGRERYAFDFTSTVTELRPQPAEVISIEEKRQARGRKSRPSTAAV